MEMKCYLFLISLITINFVSSLPVTHNREKKVEEAEKASDPELGSVLEYERYLKEVVEALESDPEFRKKLDKAPEVDIRTGKIAQELEYVSHNVRSKLDEIKRREIDRLRKLASKQFDLSNDIDRDHLKIVQHLDHANAHTFEIEDLKKLILKTSQDLAEADKKRREEFKQYELQKEYEKQAVLKELDEEKRRKFEEELRKQKERHNKHEKVHHPGNKAQLEEVWEKQDHMEGQDFDPRTFFMIHDVDGNGYWDETELKALFVKELDKVYQAGATEDDLRERAEEMERMREHVFQESDTNRDGLISFQEFMEQTKRDEFQKDPGWETVDNIPQFTHEEYLEFERKRQEEVQRLISEGLLPPHPNIPQGYYPGVGGGYQVHPNQVINNYPGQGNQMHYQQQQFQQNQGAHPDSAGGRRYSQGQPQQLPGQQPVQNAVPQYQPHPGQQPVQNAVPQYQPHPGQQPVQNAVPQYQPHPGQQPVQNAVPQYQPHPGQQPAQNAIPQYQYQNVPYNQQQQQPNAPYQQTHEAQLNSGPNVQQGQQRPQSVEQQQGQQKPDVVKGSEHKNVPENNRQNVVEGNKAIPSNTPNNPPKRH